MTSDAGISADQPVLAAALRRAAARLRAAGIEGAGDDARRLLAAVLEVSSARLLACADHILDREVARRFDDCIARRAAREPVSRIVGEREFYGRSFTITPATLDPRPDSETLITAALALVSEERWQGRPLRIVDVGTGSGCLLLTLLAELPEATGVGIDLSPAALWVARHNAERIGAGARASWLAGDALEAIGHGPFDILISNPPYIPSGEIAALEPEVRSYDPHLALDGGGDGLRCFRRLLARMEDVLPDGWALLEVGHDQADAVAVFLPARVRARGPADLRFYRDVAGRRRCVAARSRN